MKEQTLPATHKVKQWILDVLIKTWVTGPISWVSRHAQLKAVFVGPGRNVFAQRMDAQSAPFPGLMRLNSDPTKELSEFRTSLCVVADSHQEDRDIQARCGRKSLRTDA
jgi:hypothetical protein